MGMAIDSGGDSEFSSELDFSFLLYPLPLPVLLMFPLSIALAGTFPKLQELSTLF